MKKQWLCKEFLAKAPAVDLAESELIERLLMRFGRVPLMHLESVLGIPAREHMHAAVAHDFCGDRGKRDDRLLEIPADDRLLCVMPWRMQQPIEEYGGLCRMRFEAADAAVYRPFDCLGDAYRVDDFRRREDNGVGEHAAGTEELEPFKQFFALFFGKEFGIGDAGKRALDLEVRRQVDQSHRNRPRQGTATRFVHADHHLHGFHTSKQTGYVKSEQMGGSRILDNKYISVIISNSNST